ncbi:MAG: 5-(carboxyamino)imidazole ribonucleotide synthase [Saprospiraceae bacterium]|jgi:5-(carboxyamino)imidazole ribonucleotide synthase
MSSSSLFKPPRIGFIGGGQLARMMIVAAKRLGAHCIVLDPETPSPAGQLADEQIIGTYDDEAKLKEMVEQCDVTTYDLENIETQALVKLASEGHALRPAPELLWIVQDKLRQKDRYQEANLPSAPYKQTDEPTEVDFAEFGYPLVQKARRGGYDGRGVAVMKSAADFVKHLPVPSLIERFVPAKMELAVMVARSVNGETICYPVVEMLVDTDHNVLDQLISPARISTSIAASAQQISKEAVEALDGVGIFGVELFLTEDDEILINEIAPRTHNSGHHTIEACYTDQFEQHIRAITGLPLAGAEQHHSAVMINLLGEPGYSGAPICTGLDKALALSGVTFHLYGKASTRAYRKMGHITILDATLEGAVDKAAQIKSWVKVIGETKT